MAWSEEELLQLRLLSPRAEQEIRRLMGIIDRNKARYEKAKEERNQAWRDLQGERQQVKYWRERTSRHSQDSSDTLNKLFGGKRYF
jgi:hypothetical protein